MLTTWIDRNININVPMKSALELDDVEAYNNLTHEAGFLSTPSYINRNHQNQFFVTTEIRATLVGWLEVMGYIEKPPRFFPRF